MTWSDSVGRDAISLVRTGERQQRRELERLQMKRASYLEIESLGQT